MYFVNNPLKYHSISNPYRKICDKSIDEKTFYQINNVTFYNVLTGKIVCENNNFR